MSVVLYINLKKLNPRDSCYIAKLFLLFSYWSFVEKTSVKQESNPKWVQICQTNLLWPMSSPIWNCLLQQITDWLINVCSESPFKPSDDGPPNWNCQLQQITDWLMNVCSESPCKTVRRFTLLLTSSGQEWQFHIATHILWSRMAI